MENKTNTLASFALFKDLYDQNTDVYVVISKFAEYIIIKKRLTKFDLSEITEFINSEFGFSLPEAVVKTSVNKLPYLKKEMRTYTLVNHDVLHTTNIERKIDADKEKIEVVIFSKLYQYVESKFNMTLTEKMKSELSTELMQMLLDNKTDGYSKYVSSFILENQNTETIDLLNYLKNGALIYLGLTYSNYVINETKWNFPLTIFIEQEILFHLAGYNGALFKELAEETLNLISQVNYKHKDAKIRLCYFSDTKVEIDKFFDTAKGIVTDRIGVIENDAMNNIVNGCNSESDILEKRTHFYRLIKSKNINEFDDEALQYYNEDNKIFNIENDKIYKDYDIPVDKSRYVTHLNKVNILRNGQLKCDLSKSKYFILTETGKMLRISKGISNNEFALLAVNMSCLTNKLWYDLNLGFNKKASIPKNTDILIKSKIILASLLSETISNKFEEAKRKLDCNEFSLEEYGYTILDLREQRRMPEDIEDDDIDEILLQITNTKLSEMSSERAYIKDQLKQANETLDYKNALIKEKSLEFDEISKQKELLELECQRSNFARAKIVNNHLNKINEYLLKDENKLKMMLVIVGIIIFVILIVVTIKFNTFMPILISLIPLALSYFSAVLYQHTFNIVDMCNQSFDKYKNHRKEHYYREFSITEEDLKEYKKWFCNDSQTK